MSRPLLTITGIQRRRRLRLRALVWAGTGFALGVAVGAWL